MSGPEPTRPGEFNGASGSSGGKDPVPPKTDETGRKTDDAASKTLGGDETSRTSKILSGENVKKAKEICDCSLSKVLWIIATTALVVLLAYAGGVKGAGPLVGVGFAGAVGAFALTAIIRKCCEMKYDRYIQCKKPTRPSGAESV